MDTEQYVKWFRSTSPYINSHRGKTFVFALSGEVLAHANFPALIEDIVLLHRLGVRLVLCFGALPQIEQALVSAKLSADTIGGTLLINNQALSVASATLGDLRTRIESALSAGMREGRHQTTPLRAVSANFITAKPIGIHEGIDYEHSGRVRKIDSDGVLAQLGLANIVVLQAMAGSPSGELFLLSEHDVACAVASAINAEKLVLFSEQDGVIKNGELLRELNLQEAIELRATQSEISLLDVAIAACEAGIERTQIVSYTNSSALLAELFSRDGSGTLVSLDSFETIRTANIDDISAILELIAPLESDGTLVRRSREKLEEEIAYFSVIERDTSVIACAALYPFGETQAAELACVVTAPEYRNSGRAGRLLDYIVKAAAQKDIRELFVLTTKTAHWFIENGFAEVDKAELPNTKQALYNMQRSSKVLRRALKVDHERPTDLNSIKTP